jgi:alpha-maltose-1-phosphate synthase
MSLQGAESTGSGRASEIRAAIVIGGRFHAFDLARELARSGALFRLVTNYPRAHTRPFQIPDELVTSLPTIYLQRGLERLSLKHAARSYDYLNLTFARLAATQLKGANVVHGWSGYSLESFRWARRQRVKTLLERSSSHLLTQIETLEAEYDKVGIHWRRGPARWTERDLAEYQMADMIAVPSSFAKRSFMARGFEERRLLLAPFGTDTSAFAPGEKRDDVFRVIYAGQLLVRKGIHHLVDAFEQASIAHGELCLIGSPNDETPVLLKRASDRVRRLGHQPQSALPSLYTNGSVFAIASVEEGLAVVQAQALAAGLPLICSSAAGGEDLLVQSGALIARHADGVLEYPAGYVVPTGEPDAMSRCFTALASNPALLAAKRSAAISLRTGALNWSSYASRVEAGYQSLLR